MPSGASAGVSACGRRRRWHPRGRRGPRCVELPLYDTWTFSTGAGDDFPQLAEKLAVVNATALGEGFGQTAIRLRNRHGGT